MAVVDLGQVVPTLINNLNASEPGTALDAYQGNRISRALESANDGIFRQLRKTGTYNNALSPGGFVTQVIDFSDIFTYNMRIESILTQSGTNGIDVSVRFYGTSPAQVAVYLKNISTLSIPSCNYTVTIQAVVLEIPE